MKTERQKLMEKRDKLVKEANKLNVLLTQHFKMDINEALKRTYEVKLQSKGKSKQARIYVPICMAYKKVKLKLIQNKN